jgi:hypothetical protein
MTNVIRINEPYVKYRASGNEHTFTVSMAKLMDEYIEHALDPASDRLYFQLHNPITGNVVHVYLDNQQSHTSRLYTNQITEIISDLYTENKQIKLIVQ